MPTNRRYPKQTVVYHTEQSVRLLQAIARRRQCSVSAAMRQMILEEAARSGVLEEAAPRSTP